MPEEKTVNECYQHGKDTRDYVKAVEERHKEEFKEIRADIKSLVDKMINRVPPWVLFYISFLTLVVGALLAKVVFK